MTEKGVYRIIDANFNRSREALRVCEEVARFIRNSSALTRELKSIRHDISAIIKKSPVRPGALYRSRDIGSDVGRLKRTKSEMQRTGCGDIFSANIQRAKESLRVLEEFFKLIDKKNSMRFAALRFRVYAIEKKVSR